ncbi:beta-N-acetylglucosaminidase domain-containing protein [Microbacterium sp. NPDC057659]|uniref:beta-N-acetylglucosaminidase domain-containing protein n=1 Tax=Microbacterium sp. NPDC057659 TaxID=3346198 RepID=UPI00366F6D73
MKRPILSTLAGGLAIALGACAFAAAPAFSADVAAPAAPPPQILPTPQKVSVEGVSFGLHGKVRVVVGPNTDAPAKQALADIIEDSHGHVDFVTSMPKNGDVIVLGGSADNSAIDDVASGLGVESAAGLVSGGYVIASGAIGNRKVLLLNGVDGAGAYYAVQSLRQVVSKNTVPALRVRDWPQMSIRGAIEGFYGIPWSQQARLDQLAFDGAHKLNTYIYTPKDDQYLRSKWREQYPADGLADLKALVDQANAHHVNFTYALSPGNDVCYSSDADFAATTAKFDQLRALGVTSFYVALDDIPLQLNCAEDKAKFTKGNWGWLADAQTYYLNRLVKEYIEPNRLAPLQTVPTNYNGSGKDPYKDEFGLTLDPSVRVQWTGEGVFSDQITLKSVTAASANYHTDHLYIWDNFPVNDGQRGRLFLNPLTGRDPQLHTKIDGITSNPMIEPYASMIALAGYADYTWNAAGYDPDVTQAAIIRELAGDDPAVIRALEVFVDLNQNWKPYRPSSQDAPKLSADIDEYWSAFAAGDSAGMRPLQDRLATIAALPQTLKPMAQAGFYRDAQPWIEAASLWAQGLQQELIALSAIGSRDGAAATDAIEKAVELRAKALAPTVSDLAGDGTVSPDVIVPSVGDGVFAAFFTKALGAYSDWLELTPQEPLAAYPASATTTMGTYSGYAISRAVDGDPSSLYWSNAAPKAGDAVSIDLGSVREVGSIAVHQSDSDTATGDMLYHATLQYSQDGATWQDVPGTFDSTPLIQYSFATPVEARYVRVAATAPNPGGQWVKIREFQALPADTGIASNLTPAAGSSPAAAVDGDVTTAFTASAPAAADAYVTRTFSAPQHLGSVAVLGSVAGTLQVQDQSGWHDLATLREGLAFQEVPADVDGATAVRILVAEGTTPVINELATRTIGPVAGS